MKVDARLRAISGFFLGRIVDRLAHIVISPLLAWRYERRNRSSREPVTGDLPVIVSLTTYGQRFRRAHLAIESIAAGRLRPHRLILWLDDPSLAIDPTPELRRLRARGLEIKLTANLGPHTKYYPTLAEFSSEDGQYLVTGDDDILYPYRWLERLWEDAQGHPGEIICHRAHVVGLIDDRIAPYTTWTPCWSTRASLCNFATGVSGVIYPPAMIDSLKAAGDGFRDTAPKADDIWLHTVAVGAGVRVRQRSWRPRVWPAVPGSQAEGLAQTNVLDGGNDRQIAAAYTPDLVQRLVREAAERP